MKALLFVSFILIQTISLSFQSGYNVKNGKYFIVNKDNCDVLDVEKASKECGANIIVFDKHGGTNQQFILKNVGSGYVTLVNVNSGLAITIENKKEGSSLEQTEICGSPNSYQLFKLYEVCDDYFLIYNKASKLFINGNSLAVSQYCFQLAIQSEKPCTGDFDHLLFAFVKVPTC